MERRGAGAGTLVGKEVVQVWRQRGVGAGTDAVPRRGGDDTAGGQNRGGSGGHGCPACPCEGPEGRCCAAAGCAHASLLRAAGEGGARPLSLAPAERRATRFPQPLVARVLKPRWLTLSAVRRDGRSHSG